MIFFPVLFLCNHFALNFLISSSMCLNSHSHLHFITLTPLRYTPHSYDRLYALPHDIEMGVRNGLLFMNIHNHLKYFILLVLQKHLMETYTKTLWCLSDYFWAPLSCMPIIHCMHREYKKLIPFVRVFCMVISIKMFLITIWSKSLM